MDTEIPTTPLDRELRISVNFYYRLISAKIDPTTQKAIVTLPLWTVVFLEVVDNKTRMRVLMLKLPLFLVLGIIVLIATILMLMSVMFFEARQIGIGVGTMFLLFGVVAVRHGSSTLMARDAIRAVLRRHWIQ